MPNIGVVLKAEIARVARKEVRAQTTALKKSSAQYRGTIAALRRQVAGLEARLRKLGKQATKPAAAPGTAQDAPKRRFSPERLAAHRAKLGLSAADYGRLVGVSALSIYKWEQRKVRPRVAQLEALASVRSIGLREAARRLTER
jgi:DNA-binding transcriptional regulator YiaG